MISADLLDRLREADPNTHRKWQWGLMPCSKPGVSIDLNGALAEAWLQACLQAAIRARKWCGWAGRTETSCFAEIHTKGAASRFENHEILYGQADTEAEALALAYLDAIEAVKG